MSRLVPALLVLLLFPAVAAAGPIVAVVDTGVDVRHPALRDHLWTNPGEVAGNGVDDDLDGFVDDVHGADIVAGDGRSSDPAGHGTHVAGIVALRGRRATGARIMAVRVLRRDGLGTALQLARGIDYAVIHGARVINLSLAYYEPDPQLRAALDRAVAAGATIVTASGNEAADLDAAPTYPAAFRLPGMLVVASASGSTLAVTSGHGADTVDLAAPGMHVRSTLPGGRWGRMSGTSQATAVVSRAAVALLRAQPALTGPQVRDAIVSSVRAAPALRGETITGGLLDYGAALKTLLG
jgi:subtilisin family serine protease